MALIDYESFQALARFYLDLQQLRIGLFHRIRLLPDGASSDMLSRLSTLYEQMHNLEKQTLREAKEVFKGHRIWEWTGVVDGFGDVACLTFLGYVDPFYVHPVKRGLSAGMLKKKLGLAPGQRKERGKGKLGFDPHAKGRFLGVLTTNVIMAKDSYYPELYNAKKDYYMNNTRRVRVNDEWVEWPPFKELIEDPTRCPRYESCMERLKRRARRMKRTTKRPACRKHVDLMSKRWLAGIFTSHALEILREAEGLDVSNLRSHFPYIPPKEFKGQKPTPELLEAIRTGVRQERWGA